jgi:hypothetical protein
MNRSVDEIYRRMSEGGFEFRGQHQLITLAVSLSSKRFRKVAPGTFELDPKLRLDRSMTDSGHEIEVKLESGCGMAREGRDPA